MKSKGEITREKIDRHEADERRNKIGTVAHLGAGADSAKPEGQCAQKAHPTPRNPIPTQSSRNATSTDSQLGSPQLVHPSPFVTLAVFYHSLSID